MLEFHSNTEKNIPGYKKEWHHKTFKPLSDDAIDIKRNNYLKMSCYFRGVQGRTKLVEFRSVGKIKFFLKYFREGKFLF